MEVSETQIWTQWLRSPPSSPRRDIFCTVTAAVQQQRNARSAAVLVPANVFVREFPACCRIDGIAVQLIAPARGLEVG